MHLDLFRTKKYLTAAIVPAAAAALLCVGCGPKSQTPGVVAADASIATPAPALPAAPAAPDAKSFTTSGPLVAEQQADVGAERDGRVVKSPCRLAIVCRPASCWPGSTTACCRRPAPRKRPAWQRPGRGSRLEGRAGKRPRRFAPRRRTPQRQDPQRGNWEISKYKVDETTAQVDRYQSEQARPRPT